MLLFKCSKCINVINIHIVAMIPEFRTGISHIIFELVAFYVYIIH